MGFPKIPSPSVQDKLRRAAWGAVWVLLYRPSPVPLHGWRRLLLRAFGARIGRGAHPYPSARIWAPWNLTMANGACLGAGSETYNVAPVSLGAGSIVSQRAFLCTASHDLEEPGFPLTGAPIVVGDDAWVAAGAFIGPGVTIGPRAVAGACAVVVRDVAGGAIVVGNPAKPIGDTQVGTSQARRHG